MDRVAIASRLSIAGLAAGLGMTAAVLCGVAEASETGVPARSSVADSVQFQNTDTETDTDVQTDTGTDTSTGADTERPQEQDNTESEEDNIKPGAGESDVKVDDAPCEQTGCGSDTAGGSGSETGPVDDSEDDVSGR